MALERCLKCQTFIEESSLRCPKCGFEYPALAQAAPAARKRSAEGPPDFIRRENWEAAPPLKARFERTPLGMLFFLIAAAGALYAAYRAWEALHASPEGFIEVKILPSDGSSARTSGGTPPAPSDFAQSNWVFQGAAVNLITLEPAADVSIRFEDLRRSRVYETTSFKDGHYRMELPQPAGDGYFIHIEDPRYLPRCADLSRAEAAVMTEPARRATALRIAQTLIQGEPMRPPAGDQSLDLLLIPKTVQP